MLVNNTPFKLNVIVISLLMSQQVLAEASITQQKENLGYTVITATRNPEKNLTLPNSVTIVDREQIENLSSNATSLGEILTKTVPGMATSSQSMSNYSQTIRGRKIQVLIDGVPQILRGPTGIYGQGAAGGVINIITRRASSEALTFTTKVSTHAQSENFSKSASADIFQQISAASGDTSYIASAKYASTGLFYDAEGDAIPVSPHGQGGVSDSEDYDLYGKIDHYLDDNQSIELSVITSRLTQENNYHTVSGLYGKDKAILADGPEKNALGQESESWSVNSKYHHDDLMGSQLTLQAYAQSSKARNKYNTKNKAQSVTDSDKLGLRLTVNTEFEKFVNGSVFWGADLAQEKAGQYMTDGRLWSPNLEQQTISPFANVRLQLTDSWILRFGARYDLFDLDIDTFQVNFGKNKGDTVTGGDLSYSATTYNAGLTYLLSDSNSVYVSYSEGFSLPDVGRILRDGGASSVELMLILPFFITPLI
ncbi:TonB-dependent receptor [Moritella viscosa]